MPKICKYCGGEFVPRVRNSMEYCSIECRDKASGRKRYTSGSVGVCRVCGKEFVKRYGNERICSDECRDASFRQKKHKYYKRTYIPTGKAKTETKCEWCGSEANGKKYCSKNCEEKAKWKRIKTKEFGSWELYQNHRKAIQDEKRRTREEEKQKERERRTKTGICVVCGNTFTTLNPRQRTCSKACGKTLANARKHNRIPKKQIIDKDITLEALYRRDSGVCYLCGGICDWSDKDTEKNICGGSYPSIDHVIPISRGGFHAWDNVRLAHLSCNIAKSDELLENAEGLIPENAYEFKRDISPRKREVRQYSKDGELIAVYPSTADAERKTGFKRKQIQNNARGECLSYRGYVWKYTR